MYNTAPSMTLRRCLVVEEIELQLPSRTIYIYILRPYGFAQPCSRAVAGEGVKSGVLRIKAYMMLMLTVLRLSRSVRVCASK